MKGRRRGQAILLPGIYEEKSDFRKKDYLPGGAPRGVEKRGSPGGKSKKTFNSSPWGSKVIS